MENLLITGGAGYIGSHTCVELLESGYNIIILDNYSNSNPEAINKIEKISGKKVKFYECDLRNYDKLTEIFLENDIDAVIHFAGLKAVSESCKEPIKYFDNNISGTVNLLKVMERFEVKKLVFSSSATVYGSNESPYKETYDIGDVSNPYGRSKYIIELMLKDISNFNNDWKIIVLRYFNPIGAHKSGLIGEDPLGIPNNLLPYVSQVAIGKLDKLTIFGKDYDTPDGTCIRDYIHVVDLARGHIKALEKLNDVNGIDYYNLGTGKGYSVLEVVNAFEKANGIKINYEFGERRSGDLPVVFSDPSKANKELNWKTKYDIYDMCKDLWNWQKNNPDGFSSK